MLFSTLTYFSFNFNLTSMMTSILTFSSPLPRVFLTSSSELGTHHLLFSIQTTKYLHLPRSAEKKNTFLNTLDPLRMPSPKLYFSSSIMPEWIPRGPNNHSYLVTWEEKSAEFDRLRFGKSWIFSNSKVFDKSWIFGKSRIFGQPRMLFLASRMNSWDVSRLEVKMKRRSWLVHNQL